MKSIITLLAAVALLSPGCANDDDRPVKSPIDPETDFYGVVADNHGRPLQGVVVSDGYSCTATDENGVYQLTGCEHSYQIYVSVPAEYEIPLGEGLPRFWQQIAAGRKRYDFTLTPLAGGKESAFNLFCVRIGVYLLGFAVFINIGCDDACISGFVSEVFRFRIKAFLDRCCLKCGNGILVALIGSQNIKSFLVGIYIYFNRFVFARFVVIRLIGRRQTSGFSIFDECLGSRIEILFFSCGFKGVNAFLRTLELLRHLIELLLTRTEIPAIAEYAIICPVGSNGANGRNGDVVHKEHNHNEDRQCQNAVGNHTVDLVGRGQLACHILATAVVDDR